MPPPVDPYRNYVPAHSHSDDVNTMGFRPERDPARRWTPIAVTTASAVLGITVILETVHSPRGSRRNRLQRVYARPVRTVDPAAQLRRRRAQHQPVSSFPRALPSPPVPRRPVAPANSPALRRVGFLAMLARSR
jgi:hypothetical protein